MSSRSRFLGAANRLLLGAADAFDPPRLSILIFHRVRASPDPLFPGEVDREQFDELMGVVARSYRVITLGAAVAAIRAGELPPRALAITFDDGYADNETIALPILQKHGLTATVFVATGYLGGGRMWNDSVIETIRACARDSIDLGHLGLDRLLLCSPAQRSEAIDRLLRCIKYLPQAERETAVLRVHELAGSPPLPSDLMLDPCGVRRLYEAGWEIGAHTVTHPILTTLSAQGAKDEIANGRDCLQDMIGADVSLMAYPNGRPGRDYGAEHVSMVRELGFSAAVTTSPGAAGCDDDLFQLPRFTPWQRSLALWSAHLLRNRRRPPHAAVQSAS
jgi:peptidoglycan/xylan/chitin deacetylase (PgdA/CDA1 family)